MELNRLDRQRTIAMTAWAHCQRQVAFFMYCIVMHVCKSQGGFTANVKLHFVGAIGVRIGRHR